MIQDELWYEEQRKKFNDRLQAAINEEFERTHEIIMKDFVPKETPKDKGTIRNINNYRMKFWCDSFIIHRANESRELSSVSADIDLKEFDKRFNQ